MAAGVKPWVVRAGAALLLCAVLAVIFLLLASRAVQRAVSPDPLTVASASLQGLREQNRLSAFAARYVAVVTSRQTRLGLSEERTIIMPGMVRYEVDLARLDDRDVRWDERGRVLHVRLPALEMIGPQIDLTQVREYGGNGILARLTDVDRQLDLANRREGQEELLRQAREAVPLRLARDATRRAVERSFAMPLTATGVEAQVEVRFADEPADTTERWDTSVPVADVLANRQ